MNKRFPLFLLLLTGSLLLHCFEKPTNVSEGGTGSETVIGKIVNPDGSGAASASVTFVPHDYNPSAASKRSANVDSTTTDAHGCYRISPAKGTYNVFAHGRTGVSFRHSVTVTQEPSTIPADTLKAPGQIAGVSRMCGISDELNQMRIAIYIPGTRFHTSPAPGGAFGFSEVPEGEYALFFVPTYTEYFVDSVHVRVISDSTTDLDTVNIYGTTVTGKPRAYAGQSMSVSINDTVSLRGVGSDPYGEIILQEWDIGNTGTFSVCASGDTFFVASPTPQSRFHSVFRVTDNDGNTALDTVNVRVLKDAPTAILGSDLTMSINDSYTVTLKGSDEYGRITKFRLDVDADGVFDDSSETEVVKSLVSSSKIGSYSHVLQVEDDDGNVAVDTMVVYVIRDAPVVKVGPDTIVAVNQPFWLHCTAEDGFGSISSWEWDAGNAGTFVSAVGGSLSVVAPATSNWDHQCILRVIDDDGNIVMDTTVVYVVTTIPQGMKLIPSGKFVMGSDEGTSWEKPEHPVTITGFWMDSVEVTQGDYAAIMGSNPSYIRPGNNHPVYNVTWYEAALYCNARSKRDLLDTVYQYQAQLNYTWTSANKTFTSCSSLVACSIDYSKNGYRLPTEAEWEYACRAGTTTKYYWGDRLDYEYTYHRQGFGEYTAPVASYLPNPWGLYDMCGNVGEMCNDWFANYTSDAQTDPKGPVSGTKHIVRGGNSALDGQKASSERGTTSSIKVWPSTALGFSPAGFRVVLPSQ